MGTIQVLTITVYPNHSLLIYLVSSPISQLSVPVNGHNGKALLILPFVILLLLTTKTPLNYLNWCRLIYHKTSPIQQSAITKYYQHNGTRSPNIIDNVRSPNITNTSLVITNTQQWEFRIRLLLVYISSIP